jgi:hypothetical protein
MPTNKELLLKNAELRKDLTAAKNSLEECESLYDAEVTKRVRLEHEIAMAKTAADDKGGTLKVRDQQLSKELNENCILKANQKVHLAKIETLYRRVLDLLSAVGGWRNIADHWKKQADTSLRTILERGAIRAKYDLPYSIWRDAIMERAACNIPDETPIHAPILCKNLGELANYQLPDGSNDFLAAMKRVAEEFGFELRGNEFHSKKKDGRSNAMQTGFEMLYGAPADVVAKGLGLAEKDLLELMAGRAIKDLGNKEDKKAIRSLANLAGSNIKEGTNVTERMRELDKMDLIHLRNLAYLVYKNPDGTPLMTYTETIEATDPARRSNLQQRILNYELALGLLEER